MRDVFSPNKLFFSDKMLRERTPSSDDSSSVAVVTLLGQKKGRKEDGEEKRGNITSMQGFGEKLRK